MDHLLDSPPERCPEFDEGFIPAKAGAGNDKVKPIKKNLLKYQPAARWASQS